MKSIRYHLAVGAVVGAITLGLGTCFVQAQAPNPAPVQSTPLSPPVATPPASPPNPAVPVAPPVVVPGPAAAQVTPALPVAPPAATSVTPPVVNAPATPPAGEPKVIPAPDAAKPSADPSTAQVIEVPARPVAILRGKSSWDDGFKTLSTSFAKINAELAKAGLTATGRPLSVFLETDDNGFRFEAMIPIAEKPAGKDQLSAEVKLGLSPVGKAMKFQHRGAYDDIDSTYEAITAYLDEKGLTAQDMFIEEYLNEMKSADDTSLEIDVYVLLK